MEWKSLLLKLIKKTMMKMKEQVLKMNKNKKKMKALKLMIFDYLYINI